MPSTAAPGVAAASATLAGIRAQEPGQRPPGRQRRVGDARPVLLRGVLAAAVEHQRLDRGHEPARDVRRVPGRLHRRAAVAAGVDQHPPHGRGRGLAHGVRQRGEPRRVRVDPLLSGRQGGEGRVTPADEDHRAGVRTGDDPGDEPVRRVQRQQRRGCGEQLRGAAGNQRGAGGAAPQDGAGGRVGHRSGEIAEATCRGQRVEHSTDPGGGRRGRGRGQGSERGHRGDDRDGSRGRGVRTGQPGNGEGRRGTGRTGQCQRDEHGRDPPPAAAGARPARPGAHGRTPSCVRRRPRRRRPVSLNWTRSPTLDAGTAPVGRPVVARPTREPTPGATNRGLRRHHRDPQGRPQQVRGGPPQRPDPAGPDPVHRDAVPGGLRVHRGHAR